MLVLVFRSFQYYLVFGRKINSSNNYSLIYHSVKWSDNLKL